MTVLLSSEQNGLLIYFSKKGENFEKDLNKKFSFACR